MVGQVPFVYCLVDPAEPGHVRYVGMATRSVSRPAAHLTVALRVSKKPNRPSHTTNWIRALIFDGREPEVRLLEQLPKGASAKLTGFVEQCYIQSLRSIGHDLTNTSAGGHGGFTTYHTSEARQRISEAHKGRLKSIAHRAAISVGREGMTFSDEHRRNLSEAHRGHKWSEERRAAARGRKWSTARLAAYERKLKLRQP
jgi:hypothetical protein